MDFELILKIPKLICWKFDSTTVVTRFLCMKIQRDYQRCPHQHPSYGYSIFHTLLILQLTCLNQLLHILAHTSRTNSYNSMPIYAKILHAMTHSMPICATICFHNFIYFFMYRNWFYTYWQIKLQQQTCLFVSKFQSSIEDLNLE